MRALRCAFTARPMPGITNLPALFDSFTASLNSSSKKAETCFLETGFSGVLTLSAMCAMILDLLKGVAIESYFLLRLYVRIDPGVRDAAGNYSRPSHRTQGKTTKIPDKMGLSSILPPLARCYRAPSCS